MQTRFLVVALCAGIALVLGAFWQFAIPAERVRTRIPDRLSQDEPTDQTETPLSTDIEPDTPTPPPALEVPPLAPLLDNNPATGHVWLRVIDAATNRPLANTNCRLMPVGWNEFDRYTTYLNALTPSSGTTDADGLIALTADVIAGDEQPDESAQVVIDADFPSGIRFLMPVPGAWYATQDTGEIAVALGALHAEPGKAPVDVLVRRAAAVRITPRDRYGMPIPDARLYATLLTSGSMSEEWLSAFCTPDNSMWAEDWRAEAGDLRREIRREQVTCDLIGATGMDTESDMAWLTEQDAVANQFGTFDYRGLPCMGMGVVAWHPRYGAAQASINLVSGHNALDVYFMDELSCELRIKVDWEPLPEEAADLDLCLHRTGPQGLAEFIEDGDDWFARDWYFDAAGNGPRELVVRGLPPGWWHVGLGDGDSYGGANIELAPGESRTVRIHLGEDAMAHWTPVIRSDGVQLPECSLYLLGGIDPGREEWTVYFDAQDGQTESLFLAPGAYTAWLPTLEPFSFTLAPGEKRTDLFELLSISVNVTIGPGLAEWLGEVEAGARLDLLPIGLWDDARAHLYALDASMRKLDADYDLLKPGVTRAWKLPPGAYEWQLYGTENELSGRVAFSHGGPTSLHFGLDSLPGYALLDVNLIGFAVDDRPFAYLDEDSRKQMGLEPADRYRQPGPSIAMPGMFESELFDLPLEQIELSDTRRLFFAPAGRMRLRVSHDRGSRDFVVTLPSRITVDAHEVGAHGFRTLAVLSEASSPDNPTVTTDGVFVEIHSIELSADDWFERAEPGDDYQVPPEVFTARVTRSRFHGPGRGVCDYAEVTFPKGVDDLTLDLWALDYKPCATLDLVFKGRGSPGEATDAWWFGAPQAPRLYAMGAGTPRLVSITGLSEYMPNGRLEFASREVTLPPGRYRLVPWTDASAKYVKEFTLHPGRHTTVTLQGG